MNQHEKINYVEFPAKDLTGTKRFFQSVFGWSFTDYGPEYTAFENQGLDGGFFQSDLASSTANGAALGNQCKRYGVNNVDLGRAAGYAGSE